MAPIERAMNDEETVFVAAMMRARLCLCCASTKSDILEHRLVTVIGRVQRSVIVVENVDECDSCGRRTIVYSLR